MSDTWPPPGTGEGASQPPGVPGGTAPSPSPGRPTGRSLAVIGVVVAVIVVLCGGAFAVYKTDPFRLFSPGPQAAQVVPSDALGYAAIDLDPSAEQKVQALRFLNHFPAFKQKFNLTGDDDIRKAVFGAAVKQMDCVNLTYGSDIEPWLGKKFGLAVLPPSGGSDEPQAMIAVQVTDQGAAKDGLEKLQSCSTHSDDSVGYAFTGDYVVLAKSSQQAQKYADEAENSPLADDSGFKADMDSLGDHGIASVWVDTKGLFQTYGSDLKQRLPGGTSLENLEDSLRSVAASFRFASDHVQVTLSIHGDPAAGVSHPQNKVTDLPDSTAFAMSISGAGKQLADNWDKVMKALKSQSQDVQQQLKMFQQQTGLKLPDALVSLLGDNLTFALDSQGLSAQSLQQGIAGIDAGLSITGDPDKVENVYQKILRLLGPHASGLPIAKKTSGDTVAFATNPGYAKTLSDPSGNLGGTDAFDSVMVDPSDAVFLMYFNFDSVQDQLLSQLGSGDQQAKANIEPIQAFGLTVHTDDDYTVATLRMSVND